MTKKGNTKKNQTTRDKMNQIRIDLQNNFVERDRLIPVLMGLILARMNALILGPPGTAKSALVNAVCHSMGNGSVFSYLLTRYTTPDELFGPLSISGLKQDRFARVTKGYLPEASVAFLDEIWKANSSILNALLTILNEKKFFNDGQWQQTNLRSAIGASNELPEGPELEALYDRFIARFWVSNLSSREARKRVMTGKANAKPSAIQLTPSEVDILAQEASEIEFEDGIDETMIDIEDRLSKKGVTIGDRRRRAIWKALPYIAYALGHDMVNDDTLIEIVPDMTWRTPDQRPLIYKICSEVANPVAAKAQEILDAARENALIAQKSNEAVKSGSSDIRPSDALSQVNGVRLEMDKMVDKMLKLDKKGTNGRVKEATRELKTLYSGVMTIVMEQAGLSSFGGNDKTKAMNSYLED